MGRCGCTSQGGGGGAIGVSVLDTATVDVSGTGSGASPFEFDVKRSVDAGNLIEQHADGLWAGSGVWTAWTPTWAAAGGSPVVGSGSLIGRYLKIGKLLFLRIELIGGSSTSWAGTLWSFSLPGGFTAASPATINEQGGLQVSARDVSASDIYDGIGVIGPAGTTIGLVVDDGGGTPNQAPMSSTTPFAWATGDILLVTGFIEIA